MCADARAPRSPNLLIVGVPKAGTSSLFWYLGQHPDVCTATTKEPRYFTALMEPGGVLPPLREYQRYFEHCGSTRYAIEATPSYCYGGTDVRRAIDDVLDQPRVVLILRDPVDRLISAFRFQRARENLSAIDSFDAYVAACEDARRRSGGDIRREGHLKGLSIGFYGDYVPPWLDEFESRARVVFFEELESDPGTLVADLCRWLDIDDRPAASFDYAVRNKTTDARSKALARVVFGAKRRLDQAIPRGSLVRRSLREAYRKVNRTAEGDRIDAATRRRMAELYADSNRVLANALRARGHAWLPPWLSGDHTPPATAPTTVGS